MEELNTTRRVLRTLLPLSRSTERSRSSGRLGRLREFELVPAPDSRENLLALEELLQIIRSEDDHSMNERLRGVSGLTLRGLGRLDVTNSPVGGDNVKIELGEIVQAALNVDPHGAHRETH